MKFWNKSHKVRHRCWTRVYIKSSLWFNRDSIKYQVQQWPGKGRFYISPTGWYAEFEHEEDAVHFKIVFG